MPDLDLFLGEGEENLREDIALNEIIEEFRMR